MSTSTRGKKLLFGSILLFLSSALALGFAEVVLRIFPSLIPPERLQYLKVDLENVGVAHPYIGHLHTPNNALKLAGPDFKAIHHTDEHGFRNRGPWPSHADVIVLGDSVVFGYGVPDEATWPARVDAMMPGVRVFNLGLIGAGPEQYHRVYRTYGAPLRPHLVVVGFFPDNDFWDAGQFDLWLRSGVSGNYMVWRNYGEEPGNVLRHPVGATKGWLVRHSYLYNLAIAMVQSYGLRESGEPKVVRLDDGSTIRLMPSAYLRRTEGSQPGRREFRLVLNALKTLNEEVTGSGARLLVVVQPGKEQVYMPMAGTEVRNPAKPILAELDKLGIEYLDLTEAIAAHAKSGPALYFESDGHPNRKGYSLIARLVGDHVAARGSHYGLNVAARPHAAALVAQEDLRR